MEFFNHLICAIKQGGFTKQKVALGYHLLAQYLVSASVAEAARQMPAYHQAVIQAKLEGPPGKLYSGAHFVAEAFSQLSSDVTSLLAFGHLFGFFGALRALPASAILAAALRELRRRYLAN